MNKTKSDKMDGTLFLYVLCGFALLADGQGPLPWSGMLNALRPLGGSNSFTRTCPPLMCQPCPFGYLTDSNGCATCQCSSNKFNLPGGDPMHQGGNIYANHNTGHASPNFTNPCLPMQSGCGIVCDHGYVTGLGGCQFCICATPPAQKPKYNNPCSDAPRTCDLSCPGNYATSSSGCQHCSCEGTTTGTTPTPTTMVMTQQYCFFAFTKCQVTCPHGFMTDKKYNCDLCVCKDDVYNASGVSINHQPMIRLSNPCVTTLDVCMIYCASGYLAGPRNCQYCSCNE